MKKVLLWFFRGGLGILSWILYLLSIPAVRDFIWTKVLKKGKEKLSSAQTKIIDVNAKEKRGWWR